MGRYRIPADAWRQATYVLLRYPESKRELDEMLAIATSRDPEKTGSGSKPIHSDPVQTAALRLNESAKYQRLKREVRAVEGAIEGLEPSAVNVVRLRYWIHRKGTRTPRGYHYLQDLGYSERQMHRIVRRVILKTAESLGEL